MNLSTLTDRELTMLLGHSLYLGHALKTAARAEQKARLKIGRRAELREFSPWGLTWRADTNLRHDFKYGGTDFWQAWRVPPRADPAPHERPRRDRIQPCFLSESARAEMYRPARRAL